MTKVIPKVTQDELDFTNNLISNIVEKKPEIPGASVSPKEIQEMNEISESVAEITGMKSLAVNNQKNYFAEVRQLKQSTSNKVQEMVDDNKIPREIRVKIVEQHNSMMKHYKNILELSKPYSKNA